jgi:hypothetical protein
VTIGDVNLFEDPAEAAQHEREYRRRLLIRGVRGWLYANRSPRAICATLLGVCLVIAAVVFILFAKFGIQSWAGRAFLGVISTLPLFVLLVRFGGCIAFRGIDLSTCGPEFVARDDAAERERNLQEAAVAQSIDDALADDDGPDPGEVVALSIGSFGFWFGWELICRSPQLLIETYIDAELLPRQPHLSNCIARLNWQAEAFAVSAVYFGCMATFAAIVAQASFYYLKFA